VRGYTRLQKCRLVMAGFMPAIHVFRAARKGVDGRDKCLVRGHGGHLFGDITDTFWVSQVDACDLDGAKADRIAAVAAAWSNGDASLAADSMPS